MWYRCDNIMCFSEHLQVWVYIWAQKARQGPTKGGYWLPTWMLWIHLKISKCISQTQMWILFFHPITSRLPVIKKIINYYYFNMISPKAVILEIVELRSWEASTSVWNIYQKELIRIYLNKYLSPVGVISFCIVNFEILRALY